MRMIQLARKPSTTSNLTKTVLQYGTGVLNIDATRIGNDVRVNPPAGNQKGIGPYKMGVYGMPQDAEANTARGRWPANVILEGCLPCLELFFKQIKG